MLPPSLRPLAQPFEPALWRLLVPQPVEAGYNTARRSTSGDGFARRLLDSLQIRFEIAAADLRRIPATGPVVITANHPYGFAEGLILASILETIRPDWKIVANGMLSVIGELRERTILVNPFDVRDASPRNYAPLREAVRLLESGGLLVMFPAGAVATLNLHEQGISDLEWKPTAARLAMRTGAPVVPVYFEGANSVPFHLAGVLHPSLRTFTLAHEFHKLRGKTVRLRAGQAIGRDLLAARGGADAATAYLRARTMFLAHRSGDGVRGARPAAFSAFKPVAITPALAGCLSKEVASLPASAELAATRDYSVYLASAPDIPRLLEEIGRCREIAFRASGEGSGNALDLDRFDAHYRHIFLWSKAAGRVAGAYRLAVTEDMLPRFGADGLYTNTLFRYRPHFFENLGPAIELGRSFVHPDYQKTYAPLLLLWKGVLRYAASRHAPVLFGAVSISRAYAAASRGLIACYLSTRARHDLARFVAPRRPFRAVDRLGPRIRHLASFAGGVEDLSLAIADIESDGKGVPVLIRQYLRMGGRLLGFNLDRQFSDVLDALILTDLRLAPAALLERCMGREEAAGLLQSSERATA
jgi:putative hemolysin